MENADKGAEVQTAAKHPRRPLWVRFIHYSIRQARKRKTEEKPEPPADKAARRTANATIAIAVLTLVLAVVSYFQWKEIHGGGEDTHTLAVASKTQSDTIREYMVGTMADVIQSPNFAWDGTSNSMSVSISNAGHVISPNAILTFQARHYTFPAMKPLGNPRSYSEAIPQIRTNGWGKVYDIPVAFVEVRSQKETILVNGILDSDDGFGTRTKVSFCYSFIGHYDIKVPNGEETGGMGFFPCDGFDRRVRHILSSQPMPKQ